MTTKTSEILKYGWENRLNFHFATKSVGSGKREARCSFSSASSWFLPQDLECSSADKLYNLPSELRFYSAFSSNWLCQDDLNGEIQEAS